MRIGDLARRTGVSPRLMRYYEEQDLLHPSRLGNGYREYDESHVTAVRHIRVLLEAGLRTAAIAWLLPCVQDHGEQLVPTACPGVITQLQRERGRIVEQITDLRTSQQALDALLDAVLDVGGAGPVGRPDRV